MIDLASINVNLLVALDALLSERNVTEAGRKVGIAQSSMSHALANLRELFDDPLLVRSPDGMVPTPRAQQLETPLREALEGLRKAIDLPAGFDPASAKHTFSISTDAIQQVILLPRLLGFLAERAPGITLHSESPAEARSTYRLLQSGELDFAIGRFDNPAPGISVETFARDRLVYVARRGHPRIRKALGRRSLEREAQLLPTPVTGGHLPAPIRSMQEKQQRGARGFVATTPHLLASLIIVSQTDLVSVTLERVAEMYKDMLGLSVLRPPAALPDIDTHIARAERTLHSPAHGWLLDRLRELGANPAPPARR